MKLICSVGFLLLTFANLAISAKTNSTLLEQTKSGVKRTLTLTLLRFLSFFIVFVQFWVLTRVFPLYLILLLLLASTLGLIIYTLLGAISGFTLRENQQKIAVLSTIWGVKQQPAVGCTVLITSLLSLAATAVLSLWTFWKYPIGDPKAIVLIALFIFVVPQLVRIPILLLVTWPMVTSEYLDDDLRNSYLADSFSSVIYQTISLLFPFWLFKQQIQEFHWALPPFWVLLSIPLFLFILGGLLPFFVGLYRYRSQSRSMDEWKTAWLKDVAVINVMPAGEPRENSFAEKLAELSDEIKLRFSQNELFDYYQKLREEDGTEAVDAEPADDLTIQAEPAPVSVTTALIRNPITDQVKLAKQYLKGRISPPPATNEFNPPIMEIVRENYANLVHWDIRFAYLQDLLQLYEISVQGATQDIGKFVDAQLKEVKESLAARTPKKNILAGSFLSVSSTAIIYLFKHYEPYISGLVDKLVR